MLCDYCGKSKIHYNHDLCSHKMWLEGMDRDIDGCADDTDPWAAMLLGEDTSGEVPC